MFQIQISECKKGVQGADILDAVEPADFSFSSSLCQQKMELDWPPVQVHRMEAIKNRLPFIRRKFYPRFSVFSVINSINVRCFLFSYQEN